MALNRLFSIFAISGVILSFTVFAGCVTADTPVSLYRPTAQYQANLTVDEWIEKGDAFYYQDDYANAQECYFRALIADPSRIDVLNSYGVTLANTGFYENALVIFNIASQIDPYDETVQFNISFCRQQIAIQTQQQRQLELQRQQQQQENFNNLVASLNSLSASITQVQQNQSGNTDGGTGGSSGGQGQSASSGGGSSGKKNNYDISRARRDYANAVSAARDAHQIVSNKEDISGSYRLSFQNAQANMKKIREEAARNGHTIEKSKWETERLPRS